MRSCVRILLLLVAAGFVRSLDAVAGEIVITGSDEASKRPEISAYVEHGFEISSPTEGFGSPKWELMMPLSDGTGSVVGLTDNGFSCAIPVITDPENYEITDGRIRGQLRFTCVKDADDVMSASIDLIWSLKPYIERVTITKIVDKSPDESYDAHFEAVYYGATSIRSSIEEEYSSVLKTKYYYDYPVAVGVAENILSPYRAWIDFEAGNQYGKDVYTVELGPGGEIIDQSAIDIPVADEATVTRISVYDMSGRMHGEVENVGQLRGLGLRGLFILRLFSGDNAVGVSKVVLR